MGKIINKNDFPAIQCFKCTSRDTAIISSITYTSATVKHIY